MKHAALALLLLMGGATAQAQDTRPECDPEVERREDSDWWKADWFSVRWTHWVPDRGYVAITSYTYDEHYRHHLEAEGPFSRWSSDSFFVAPKTMRTRGKLWAQLSADGTTLPPVEVSRDKGFYGGAGFKAYDVKALIANVQELTITFYDSKQAVVDRYTLPRTAIEAGAAQMMSFYRDYRARLAEPPAPCPQEIILLH
jgi:hypothetical protein